MRRASRWTSGPLVPPLLSVCSLLHFSPSSRSDLVMLGATPSILPRLELWSEQKRVRDLKALREKPSPAAVAAKARKVAAATKKMENKKKEKKAARDAALALTKAAAPPPAEARA